MDSEQARRRFYDLVWPQAAAVLRAARILSGNDAEADDLAQETLMKAFKAIDRFQEGTNVQAWLTTILRNTRIDRLRAMSHDLSLDQLDVDVPDESAADPTDSGEWENPQAVLDGFADQEIIDALQRLPEEIRWTLLLVDVEGMDQRDAAEMLRVPVGTIKSRAHRGRAMLREALLPVARERRMI